MESKGCPKHFGLYPDVMFRWGLLWVRATLPPLGITVYEKVDVFRSLFMNVKTFSGIEVDAFCL